MAQDNGIADFEIIRDRSEAVHNTKLFKISGWLRRKFKQEIVSGRELRRKGFSIKRLLGLNVIKEEIVKAQDPIVEVAEEQPKQKEVLVAKKEEKKVIKKK